VPGDIESNAGEFNAFSRNLEVGLAAMMAASTSVSGLKRASGIPRRLAQAARTNDPADGCIGSTRGQQGLPGNFQTSGSCP
jgi:hypothetical protein